ncbi:hypothetical protein ACH5A7_20980 [Streptomyces sp. NPDC018955]|uniref:hypothetical protein n=1 Tax=Streptomyces sp. NPDC018955 TaxID=3365055 RepID=UPI003794B80E
MTFAYTDPDGHHLELEPDSDHDNRPVVTIWARAPFARVPVRIPLDRIEEVVAGLRDTARQAAGATPDHRHTAALHHMGVTNIPTEQP